MRSSGLLLATLSASVSAVQVTLSKFADKNLWYASVGFGHSGQTQYLLLDTGKSAALLDTILITLKNANLLRSKFVLGHSDPFLSGLHLYKSSAFWEPSFQSASLKLFAGSPWTFTTTNSTVCYDPIEGGRTRCSSVYGTPYTPTSTLTRYNGSDNQARLAYADLSVVRGTYGFEDLSLGSLNQEQAPFVLATTTVMESIWPGTGILGLSPDLPDEEEFAVSPEDVSQRLISSSRHDLLLSRPSQTNKNALGLAASSSHEGVLTNIFNNTDLDAYFGLALSRASQNSTWGGILSIGERLNISEPYINATGAITSVPLEPYTGYSGEQLYIDYSGNASVLAFGRDSSSAELYPFGVQSEDTKFVFDSGTEVIFVPYIHAALVAARFSPPGYLVNGLWFVECDATPPSDVAIVFNDKPFYINPLDMVVQKEAVNRTELCLSAFQGDYRVRILGSPFLKNVYIEMYRAEYVGEDSATMWIAAREHYVS